MTLAERNEGGGGAEGRGARRGEGAFPDPVAEVNVFCRAPAFILMLASLALRSGVRAVETSGGLPNLIGGRSISQLVPLTPIFNLKSLYQLTLKSPGCNISISKG